MAMTRRQATYAPFSVYENRTPPSYTRDQDEPDPLTAILARLDAIEQAIAILASDDGDDNDDDNDGQSMTSQLSEASAAQDENLTTMGAAPGGMRVSGGNGSELSGATRQPKTPGMNGIGIGASPEQGTTNDAVRLYKRIEAKTARVIDSINTANRKAFARQS
jgi:hypothetical protein